MRRELFFIASYPTSPPTFTFPFWKYYPLLFIVESPAAKKKEKQNLKRKNLSPIHRFCQSSFHSILHQRAKSFFKGLN